MDLLNVERADEYPTVTGYMEWIVEFIAGLVETGHAYEADGDVYFAVDTFPDYGKLSRRDLNSQLVAARKELESGQARSARFRALEASQATRAVLAQPVGPGRPGWHIECSAMARKALGDQLDIHGGGADLIFPHHENEIAQSESLTGKVPFVAHWVHGGLVTIEGEKMAHSLDNFFTIDSVLARYTPAEVRLYLTGTHYRSPLVFAIGADGSIRGIEDARSALARLRRALGSAPLTLDGELDQDAVRAFEAAMDADFNTPDALAVVFDLVRELNRARDAGAPEAELDRSRRTILRLLCILGLELPPVEDPSTQAVGPLVELLLDVRRQLREARQWALADQIRDRLAALDIVVEDKAGGGSTWRPADPH